MKTLCFLIIIAMTSPSFAQMDSLLLEVGSPHRLSLPASRAVTISNKKALKALDKKTQSVVLIGVAPGTSLVSAGGKTWRVEVLLKEQINLLNVIKGNKDLKNYIKYSIEGHKLVLSGFLKTWKLYGSLLNLLHAHRTQVVNNVQLSRNVTSELHDFLRRYNTSGNTPLPEIGTGKNLQLIFPDVPRATQQIIENHYGTFGFEIIYQKTEVAKSTPLLIDIYVTEVNRDYSRQLGIDWKTPSTIANSLNTPGDYNWLDRLQAMESQGEGQLLAHPQLYTMSGHEANFQSGGELGIKSYGYQSQSIFWKPYGIIIKVKPFLSPSNEVSMDISVEISNPDASQSIEGVPALKSNKVSTKVFSKLGHAIVLSGIIQNRFNTADEGIIGLKNIPILGRLFSSDNYKNNKSEFFILVVPKTAATQTAEAPTSPSYYRQSPPTTIPKGIPPRGSR